jgi:hypothetical protein
MKKKKSCQYASSHTDPSQTENHTCLEFLSNERRVVGYACCAGSNSKSLVLLFVVLNTQHVACRRQAAGSQPQCAGSSVCRATCFYRHARFRIFRKKALGRVEWGMRKCSPGSIQVRSHVHVAPVGIAKANIKIRCKNGLMATR